MLNYFVQIQCDDKHFLKFYISSKSEICRKSKEVTLVRTDYLHWCMFGIKVTILSIWIFAWLPESETYAMMLAGLGLKGFMVRRKKSA